MESSIWFDVQCLWKLEEKFTCIGLFYRDIWSIWHWTVGSKSLRSGYHGSFNNCLVLLLFITLSSQFVYFFMLSRNLCSYKVLLLNDWSTPIITICCLSRSDCNNHLRMTHYGLNESMSGILSITLVNKRDLEHCAAWALLPSFLGKTIPGGGNILTGICKFLVNDLCVGVVSINYWSPSKVTLWLLFLSISNGWASSSTATFTIEYWSFSKKTLGGEGVQ